MDKMQDILSEIVANKREEVALDMHVTPAEVMAQMAQRKIRDDGFVKHLSMRKALEESPTGIIAEFKRKSPSKGWIHADAKPEDVVPLYAQYGAAALSILTDQKYFGGDIEYVRQMRPLVPNTPILRKEFIVDEYQLNEARLYGADAVLLIAADLYIQEVKQLTLKAHELGLEVLLEVHDPKELEYVREVPEVDMLGVNNRSLGTFHTDVQHSFDIAAEMRKAAPGMLLVSESGISKPEVVKELRKVGFRGFLIGECFMKEANPGLALREFALAIKN